MSTFDDPNREAIGLAPIWSGAGGEAPEGEASSATFDPGAHTVDEVKAHVAKHPEETQAVYDAEASGKNRATLVEWLTGG